jgi:hypothetical protein
VAIEPSLTGLTERIRLLQAVVGRAWKEAAAEMTAKRQQVVWRGFLSLHGLTETTSAEALQSPAAAARKDRRWHFNRLE